MRISTLMGAAILGVTGIAAASIAAPQRTPSGQTSDGMMQNNTAVPDHSMRPDTGTAPDASTTMTPDTTTSPNTAPGSKTPTDGTGMTSPDNSGSSGTTTPPTGG